jgi:WbqC-like protein family
MKKVAIMQPYFLPYIGYFQLINAVDEFLIYDDVNYINKGWINRNNILVNGKACLFSIPLKEASQNKLINEIEIINDGKWQSKLLKTIEQSYKKAPNYQTVAPMVHEIINFGDTNLSKYICNSLSTICKYLQINTEIIPSSSNFNNNQLKAQDRILDICLQLRAENYINPIGGVELYDKEIFEKSGIKLNFIKTQAIEYKQFSNTFTPHLSILDLIMFNSKQVISELINRFELI